MASKIERNAAREPAQMVPRPVDGEPGLVVVDTTWGEIQPLEVAPGVQTVGELDVIAHLDQGLPVVDGRTRDFYEQATIPGAGNVPYTETTDWIDYLDDRQPIIFFCNGPQCGQSPIAIKSLLEAGYPVEMIRYYRGGMHDWLTLGLLAVPGGQSETSVSGAHAMGTAD